MVPKGWRRVQIADIANIQVGRDLDDKRFSKIKTEIHKYPVYSNTIENEGLYGYYNSPDYTGDAITIVGRGVGLGTAFSRYKNHGFNAIGRLLILQVKNNNFDIRFLSNYINFSLRIHNESGGIPQLPRVTLSKYIVLIPPISEQKKIAQILSTWDKAITITEQLLANSQQQKKALMQQLLTGKKRLLDENGVRFSGMWKKGDLSDLGNITKGKALSTKNIINGDYPVIAGGKKSPYTHNNFTHKNVITVSASGAYAGYVSYHPYKLWASDCSVISPKSGSNIIYIYHIMTYLQEKIYSLQSGGAQPHVYPKDLKVLKVNIPILKEQQKIAAVLTAADKEITVLQQKLDMLKQEKKALMQQLLTGKRRVKIEEAA